MSEFVHRTPAETLESRQTVSEKPYSVSDSYAIDEKLEKKLLKENERRSKRRARLPLKVGAVALVLSSMSFAYWHDVDTNRTMSLESQPEITTLGDHPEQLLHETSTFYLAGFDTMNGDAFGDEVGVSIQEILPSNSESINYGNAPLDAVEIAKKIISYTEDRKLESIALAGNSLGGIVAAEVAEYIIVNSDVEVDAIMLNATPDGRQGLLPETQGDLSTMMQWLEAIPGSKYSTFARYAATLAQDNGAYTHSDGPIDTVHDFINSSNKVWAQVQEHRRPGMWLLVDQALAITNSDLDKIMHNIGEQRGNKRMPVVVSMRTKRPADDHVVDVVKSSRNICTYAENANLSCEIVYVDGAHHTSYDFNTDSFTAALTKKSEEIREEIQTEAALYAYSTYASDTLDEELPSTMNANGATPSGIH